MLNEDVDLFEWVDIVLIQMNLFQFKKYLINWSAFRFSYQRLRVCFIEETKSTCVRPHGLPVVDHCDLNKTDMHIDKTLVRPTYII